jgi:hypothetical protein
MDGFGDFNQCPRLYKGDQELIALFLAYIAVKFFPMDYAADFIDQVGRKKNLLPLERTKKGLCRSRLLEEKCADDYVRIENETHFSFRAKYLRAFSLSSRAFGRFG